jgi:hypothetical protein
LVNDALIGTRINPGADLSLLNQTC